MTDLALATEAALTAGKLLHENFSNEKTVDEATHHDIKLALDKESQDLITEILLGARPGDALYGEEGIAGNQDSDRQWIVDPIDGTVNFFYGIPHFCVSIALRVAGEIVVGVIHDPMVGETWTVEKGGPALLNGKPIQVSSRETFEQSILFVGCGKDEEACCSAFRRPCTQPPEGGTTNVGSHSFILSHLRNVALSCRSSAFISSFEPSPERKP